MARYIDADKIVNGLREAVERMRPNDNTKEVIDIFCEGLQNEPTADVVEVKHGEWIDDGDCFHCSVCNRTYHLGSLQTIYDVRRRWNYCANCGAKMDGEKK